MDTEWREQTTFRVQSLMSQIYWLRSPILALMMQNQASVWCVVGHHNVQRWLGTINVAARTKKKIYIYYSAAFLVADNEIVGWWLTESKLKEIVLEDYSFLPVITLFDGNSQTKWEKANLFTKV